MIGYRHADARLPFLWEGGGQPPGRWHGQGEGPTHYLADTPDGAWAEFLRHEGITGPDDLATIRRALWAVELGQPPTVHPRLPAAVLVGGTETYEPCQAESRRLRSRGASGLEAPSAALLPGGAAGLRVEGGLAAGRTREGRVVVLFGPRPDLVGWRAAAEGRPHPDLLPRVRHFA
ncbi:MAG: RES family NAD+ phosphorylase [Gemmatimonadetes bacterium]|nr:RES family NAD+ phosphorylase [Gemmatimonadota bacterium]